jgi:hypothetical protein
VLLVGVGFLGRRAKLVAAQLCQHALQAHPGLLGCGKTAFRLDPCGFGYGKLAFKIGHPGRTGYPA